MMNVKLLPQYLAWTNIGTFFKLLLFHYAGPSGIRGELFRRGNRGRVYVNPPLFPLQNLYHSPVYSILRMILSPFCSILSLQSFFSTCIFLFVLELPQLQKAQPFLLSKLLSSFLSSFCQLLKKLKEYPYFGVSFDSLKEVSNSLITSDFQGEADPIEHSRLL